MSTNKSSVLHLLLFCFGSVAASNTHLSSKIAIHTPHFTKWAKAFEKVYSDEGERLARLLVWIENHEFIEQHNTQNPPPTFTLDHNFFSDLTNEEYQQYNKLGPHGRGIIPAQDILKKDQSVEIVEQRKLSSEENVDLPTYVNWIEQGAVTPAKNQGRCGSCWSFSAVGSIEGAKFLNDGELVSLSEQMMMDCDHTDMSCEGGIMESGFIWESNEGGLCTESDYPYLAEDSFMCWDANCTEVPGTRVQSFTRLNGGNVEELMQSVAVQPTSIAMAANSMEFQFYHDGVFNGTCSQHLDHGILAVGYGFDEDSGLDYFLVKNSWGPIWGDNGFFKISTFQAEPGDMGMCGILNNYNTAPSLF